MTQFATLQDVEHIKFPKMPRLNREAVITEKIDGTNAAIGITEDGCVYAQSRNKLIKPVKSEDPFGFAHWVESNAALLPHVLGIGLHFGEWYGSKIQRGYGLTDGERYFALFNTGRWTADELQDVPGMTTVPVIGVMPLEFDTVFVDSVLDNLRRHGSFVTGADRYDNPEGICIFHSTANISFKVTLKDDHQSKSSAAYEAARREGKSIADSRYAAAAVRAVEQAT